jgi:DNA primase
MPTWINFKELRKRLRFADVLRHYKIETKLKGDRAMALCSLPGHSHRTDGKPRTASLSINLTRNIFRCFGCNQSGNALEFACRMEGFDPSNTDEFRQAALKIAEVFKIDASGSVEKPKQSQPAPAATSRTVVNAPLDFELQNLDPNHPYLLNRGFTPETIEHFGLGFCAKGLMKDRIVIPLRDDKAALVGYAGRVVDDTLITDANPRYRFPSGRERQGIFYDFQKSRFLYNGFALACQRKLRQIYVVESFTACWWLHQCGISNVVALMGASCSSHQAKLLIELLVPHGLVTILTDGDEAGERCAVSVFMEVAPYRRVRWAKLETGKQPTDFTADELGTMLGRK